MTYANYSVFLRYFDLCFRGCFYIITATFRHNLRHEEKNKKKSIKREALVINTFRLL